ncbi:M23 family metallopeptidase [Thalassotalea euphylliae]|uniref:M23 family peptidase n=1 Tax=Thalassotalea euphylliae TaxID=1655234 RepID=A0A3E0U595_9GAMM|nr:M23 family metallopeptidase [Thalassotalea euphylliae]REL31910.1 M23 family peptidase [Thalassotalea euphylliae]
MSLTLLYRGNNVRFSMRLSKFHWLSALSVFALVSGLVIHLVISANAIPANSSPSIEPTTQIAELPSSDKQQVIALTLKLAELQSQVLRLNALGDRLAEENNISEKEFNFDQQPPAGGPVQSPEQVKSKTLAELLLEIEALEQQVAQEQNQLMLLESVTLGHHIQSNSYLSGRPIVKGWLSSYYGVRKDPFHGRPAMHKGVDFAGKENAPIIATASGIVSWSGERYGYGNLIEIDHGDGYKTRYGHNKQLLVELGDVVEKGQIIARMGSTGRSTGPHVHYEILRNNTQINPIKYVYRKAK